MDSLFQLHQVKVKTILSIPDLTIHSKIMTGLIGESGSGKSTLLRVLNRMIQADSGKIRFKQQNLNEIDPVVHRRHVVMLPQNPILIEGSIQENLCLGRLLAEKPPLKDDTKLEEWMRRFRIQHDLKDDAGKLSGGEKQRIALIRALLLEPEVLLLDEPTSALDDRTEGTVMDIVREIQQQNGVSVVFVTHSQAIAKAYSDVLLRMSDGSVDVVKGA